MIASDESSLLPLYKFEVPKSFQTVYGKELHSKQYKKLNELVNKIKPYRFVPGVGRTLFNSI